MVAKDLLFENHALSLGLHLPRAAPSGSGWFSTINPCNHGITVHKSQSKMHFTLRLMVYNNGLVGCNVCRLENFKFTCAHVQGFFF